MKIVVYLLMVITSMAREKMGQQIQNRNRTRIEIINEMERKGQFNDNSLIYRKKEIQKNIELIKLSKNIDKNKLSESERIQSITKKLRKLANLHLKPLLTDARDRIQRKAFHQYHKIPLRTDKKFRALQQFTDKAIQKHRQINHLNSELTGLKLQEFILSRLPFKDEQKQLDIIMQEAYKMSIILDGKHMKFFETHYRVREYIFRQYNHLCVCLLKDVMDQVGDNLANIHEFERLMKKQKKKVAKLHKRCDILLYKLRGLLKSTEL